MKMHPTRSLLLAALSVVALGLSACGGSTSEPATPDSSGTTSAAAEATTSAAEQQPAAADFPFQEGPVDVADFAARYKEAMQSVRSMTVKTTSGAGTGNSVTYIDASDPASPRSYSVSEADGQEMEVVTQGDKMWMRTGEGDWVAQDLDVPAATQNWEDPAATFSSVELVSAAERKFAVELKLSPTATQTIPATLFVDDQFRASRMELDVNGVQSTTEYLDYDKPVEIPTVG